MASITIHNLDEETKQRLKVRAAEHGRSMEEEASDILRQVISVSPAPRNLAASIRSRIENTDRSDLDPPARELIPEPPHLDPVR